MYSQVSVVLRFLVNNLDDFTDHQFLLNEAYRVILDWMTEGARKPEHINHFITHYTSIVAGTADNPLIRVLLSVAALETVALAGLNTLQGSWEKVVFSAVVNSANLPGTAFPQAFISSRFRNVQALGQLVQNIMFAPSFCNNPTLCLNMFICLPFVIAQKCKDRNWSTKVYKEIQMDCNNLEVCFVANCVKLIGEVAQLSKFMHKENPCLLYEYTDYYLTVFNSIATLVHWIEHCNAALLGRKYPILRSYVDTAVGDVTDAVISIGTLHQDDPIMSKLQDVLEHIGLGTKTGSLASELIKRDISAGKTATVSSFQKYVYSNCIMNKYDEYYLNIANDSCLDDVISSDENISRYLDSDTISNISSSDCEFE